MTFVSRPGNSEYLTLSGSRIAIGAMSKSAISLACVLTVVASGPRDVYGQVRFDGWTIGLQGQYVASGGDQFYGLANGFGAGGFVRRQLGPGGAIEVGASITRHRVTSIVCIATPCLAPPIYTTLGEFYVRPTIQTPTVGAGIVPYVGIQVGILTGELTQDPGPGLGLGGVGGVRIRVVEWLAAEVGLTGTMVYVGTDLPRSGWGHRVGVQLGLAVH